MPQDRPTPLAYGEICAGGGGGSLGLHRAGLQAAWLNELDGQTAAVLRVRFPGVPVYQTDAAALDGAALVRAHGPLDLMCGGTPCQDLSVIGRRAGLHGSRSVIFFELIRLWSETQAMYCLWENVCGALYSNQGRDFAAVLSAFVGAPVIPPRAGWCRAGVAAGPAAVAAWRVLDAQYFGVPQRRARVFVFGARAGGCDPAQILLESNDLPAASASCRPTRQTDCGAAPPCPATAFDLSSLTRPSERTRIEPGRVTPTLKTNGQVCVVPDITDVNTITGIPRHLLPIEYERLMGWPDNWTQIPDRHGKASSDTFRYRVCGNGIVSHVTQWIGENLVTVYRPRPDL